MKCDLKEGFRISMKRMAAILFCTILLFSLVGCLQESGYMEYTGIYVKTTEGEHILISSVDGEEVYLILREEGCKSLDKLKNGDKITIQVPCVLYEESILSERKVYDWERKLFGRTKVPQTTLDTIEELLRSYESE